MIELLISMSILILISVTVVADVTRGRKQEELQSSVRMIMSSLRSLQSRALSASSVMACGNDVNTNVCEVETLTCGSFSCTTSTIPTAIGVTFNKDAKFYTMFAEVDPVLTDYREDTWGREKLGTQGLIGQQTGGSVHVKIQSLKAGTTDVAQATVTFDRQSGLMRINPCGTPAGAPICGMGGEPKTLEIVIEQTDLGQTKTVRLNALTGKISID